jgi:hypothetical protein
MTTSNQSPGIFIQLPGDFDFNFLDLNSLNWRSLGNDVVRRKFELVLTIEYHGLCQGFDPLVKSILDAIVLFGCREFSSSTEIGLCMSSIFILTVKSPSAEIVLLIMGLISPLGKNIYDGDDFTSNGKKQCSASVVLQEQQ